MSRLAQDIRNAYDSRDRDALERACRQVDRLQRPEEKTMLTCSKKDCGKPATKLPVMTFTAVIAPLGPRAEGQMDLPVCDQHASIDPDEYITDEGWAQIVGKMAHMGKARPDRASVRIHFKDIQ